MRQRQIALLRGVNVGKHNRVPMAQLREVLASRGFADVRTHLQSGNVVFSATTPAAESERAVAEGIRERFGFDVPVVVRTRDELAAAVAADPLSGIASDPAKYLVTFLSASPDPPLAELDPTEFEPDVLRFGTREVFAWCPNGVRESRVPLSWWERRFGVTATSRNWSTVTRLLRLADELGPDPR